MLNSLIYLSLLCICFAVPILCCLFTTKYEVSFLNRRHTSALKGIAIICVVVCHFMGRFGNGITWFTPLGGIGVSIFLVISGYGLSVSWNSRGWDHYWQKRLIAVVIPYAIFESISYWAFADYFSLCDYLLDVLCIKPLYANGWYMQYILGCYCLFWLVMIIPFMRTHKIGVFVGLSVISFFVLGGLQSEQALSFTVGLILAEYKEEPRIKQKINWKSALALLCFGILALAVKQIDVVRSSPELCMKFLQLCVKLPICLSIIIASFLLANVVNFRGLEIVGAISYEMYLCHGVVLPYVPISIVGTVQFIIGTLLLTVGFWFVNKQMRYLFQKYTMRKQRT